MTSAIPFQHLPSNIRAPLFYAELDNSQANTSAQTQRTLIVGQMLTAGSASPGVPVQAMSVAAAKALGGVGSIIAGMAAAYRASDPTGEVWLLPLLDDGSAAAATGSVALTGTTAVTGTVSLYIAGQPLSVAIASGQTAAQAATTIGAAITAAADMPVTASVSSGTITLTAKNKGFVGNDIDIRLNYQGSAAGEFLPAGLSATVTAMSGGSVNPSLTQPLVNLQDMSFDFIVMSLNDTTSTAAMKAFLGEVSGRWSPLQQLYGGTFYGLRGTSGTAAAWGAALNDQHAVVLPAYDSPSPSWVWAADLAGTAAMSLRADPALPLQYLTLSTVLSPPIASRWPLVLRNQMLYSGCSTYTVDANGSVTIENIVTTYVTNGQGQADNSYLEVETLYTLAYALRFMRARVQANYSRKKLAADGTRLIPGTNVVTPSTIRADIIAAYRELEAAGITQQSDVFSANLVVQQNVQNPNRVDVLWPAILVDQLRVFALLAQFRLS
ncbi:phage tail sheath gpL-like [Sphingomonas vulcanisoli]|uniref:Phage tail sheath gpL-like n=1 Tax=Sphingomonas vulcanisoli TaxID=1658060 RepID=A0ABX0TNY5_9SPHN|nr:phage tail sheath C-terminal domain-containing protein [Sphingomonas vulcanisoli]NIJ07239.1 phage tail sheath gpL-like [Sphingomonas vulcanisoli]